MYVCKYVVSLCIHTWLDVYYYFSSAAMIVAVEQHTNDLAEKVFVAFLHFKI